MPAIGIDSLFWACTDKADGCLRRGRRERGRSLAGGRRNSESVMPRRPRLVPTGSFVAAQPLWGLAGSLARE